jgi:uncharacterized protein YjiK
MHASKRSFEIRDYSKQPALGALSLDFSQLASAACQVKFLLYNEAVRQPLLISASAACACALVCCVWVTGSAAAPSTLPGSAEATAARADAQCAELTAWVFDAFDDLAAVPEPSGMCYVPARNTLFIVDDGSQDRAAGLYEVDLEFNVLQGAPLGKDLEGVCFCPADGLLYVCDESGEQVYQVDPDGLKLRGTRQVSRLLDGMEVIRAGGNGFEGIEYIPTADGPDYFLLLNQDDPTGIARVEYAALQPGQPGEAALTSFTPTEQINAGELYYDPERQELWEVHAWVNVIEVLAVPSLQRLRWEVCPGCAQEAVAVDGEGRLWIGYDSGGLSRYLRKAQP